VTLLTGCDVSKFQHPSLVDWGRQDFGIVRATYGTSIDKSSTEHVKRIRAAGKVVGMYHFFRADQDPHKQFDAFASTARSCGLTAGDLLPCIDIEDFPGHSVGADPATDVRVCKEFARRLQSEYGGSIIYTTQRDWHRLGKPGWFLEHPLWVAHYPRKGSTSPLTRPATPANAPWRIWQCLVGPLGQNLQAHDHPQAVDQNLATDPLPLVGETGAAVVSKEVPWLGLDDDYWAEAKEARDRHFADS